MLDNAMTIESGGTRTAWHRVTSRRDQKIDSSPGMGRVCHSREEGNIQGLRVDHQLTPLDVFPLFLPPILFLSTCVPLLCDILT